jgi:raffinose/stachyose/melibiose transport system permease protein
MSRKSKSYLTHSFVYGMLAICMIVVLYPLYIMIITSFKSNLEVLKKPLSLPSHWSFSAYSKVLELSNYVMLYKNSILITAVSLSMILLVSLLASYPLSRFQFRFNRLIYFYFIIGVMLPIRLAVVDLFGLLQSLNLYDHLEGLILVYSAMGIPFSILIITGFMQGLPREIEESAKMDGCNDTRLLWVIITPLVRPALATAAIYNFMPIWNDFYFPLIFLKSEALKTVPLGTAIFFGQYQTQWPTVFAALTMSVLPPLLFYLLLSKNFIKGLTAGAVKG